MAGSPELLRIVDDLIKTDLQDARDVYFRLLLVSSAMVIIGVAL